MKTPTWPLGPIVEEFPITLPDGAILHGSLYRVPSRRTGRRIVVRDDAGEIVADTDECYDLGNATFRANELLAALIEGRKAATCE
jgi:hypothetical protein